MPRPTSATDVQRPDLGMTAWEYSLTASQRGFIGTELLPYFPVKKQASNYGIIPIESILKIQDVSRTPKGNYNRGDWKFETGLYSCSEKGFEEPLDDVEADLYEALIDAEMTTTEIATDVVLRKQEVEIAAAIMNTSNFSNSAVGTEWSTITATPRSNVIAGKKAMRAASGLEPNAMAMSQVVWENLMLTTEVLNVFRYTTPIEQSNFEAQKSIMAQYFGVERILVGNAIKDTAKKGKTFVISDVWDDEYVFLGKLLPQGSRNLKQPILGATFFWEQQTPESLIVEQYREEAIRADIFRARQFTDPRFVFTGAGYLLSNITA